MATNALDLALRHISRRTALVAGLLAFPLAHASAQAGNVAPGDDFFTYANQRWLDTTRVPAGRERWTARNEIEATTRRQVDQLFADARHPGADPTARKVGDFLAAYEDETGIESRGLAPLRPALDQIEAIRDKRALTRALGRDVRADVDPRNWGIFESRHILGVAVDAGIHGEPGYRLFLVQGGLGLSDPEQYLGDGPALVALRGEYRHYIAGLLTAAGFADAEARAEQVVALETAMARSHLTLTASANDSNADTVWTRADFGRRAPGIDWAFFLAEAGLTARDSFIVWQPSAITGLAALVGSTPLAAWKDYLRVRLLDRDADLLPQLFAKPALAFHGALSGGSPDTRPRAERAQAVAQLLLRDALGQLYAERYFPAAEKARAEGIVRNVIAAFRARVEQVSWMSSASRTIALAKLDRLEFLVGYPDKWPDLSALRIDPRDPVGNLDRIERHHYTATLARIGKRVDRREWMIATQRAGAVLNFQLNSYNFPAALMQAPKYDPAASDAANYGAIGAIIGHEVSHFVDQLGADYGVSGESWVWWTAEDRAGFQSAADRLGRQVAAYPVGPGLAIDPKLTQTENVADLAGLTAAFEAYRRTLGASERDTALVRRMDREFFIGFAQSWRGIIAEGGLGKVVMTDNHAPERYRVAIVRNLDAWYEVFDVTPGQLLYLPPADRVKVW